MHSNNYSIGSYLVETQSAQLIFALEVRAGYVYVIQVHQVNWISTYIVLKKYCSTRKPAVYSGF